MGRRGDRQGSRRRKGERKQQQKLAAAGWPVDRAGRSPAVAGARSTGRSTDVHNMHKGMSGRPAGRPQEELGRPPGRPTEST